MNPGDITGQALVERQILGHVAEALREALGWETSGGNFARKLSTVRFVGGSFQRHLDRLRALDEYEGYRELVLESKPHLAATVQELKDEHDHYQGQLTRLMVGLDSAFQDDAAGFDVLCADLLKVIDGLKGHSQRITDLLHSSFVQDDGGSG